MANDHPLKIYRKRQGLTMLALAKEIKASKATVSRIEKGLQFPSQQLLHRIVQETGLTADSLLRASRSSRASL